MPEPMEWSASRNAFSLSSITSSFRGDHCSPHTSKFAPWKLKFSAAFGTIEQPIFETQATETELILILLFVTLRKSEFSTAQFTARTHSANPNLRPQCRQGPAGGRSRKDAEHLDRKSVPCQTPRLFSPKERNRSHRKASLIWHFVLPEGSAQPAKLLIKCRSQGPNSLDCARRHPQDAVCFL
jgi:hypothetical protein